MALAKHLRSLDAKLFGGFTCPYCIEQRRLFGDAISHIEYVECHPYGPDSGADLCEAVGVRYWPTWQIGGELYIGLRSLEELAELSGYGVPAAPAPTSQPEAMPTATPAPTAPPATETVPTEEPVPTPSPTARPTTGASECQADFSAEPTICVGLTPVQFTDRSTGNITRWAWDLDGDGIVDSTVRDAMYFYQVDGAYSVTLTVSGPDCDDTVTRTHYIRVTGAEP